MMSHVDDVFDLTVIAIEKGTDSCIMLAAMFVIMLKVKKHHT
jgi:hypothetical protein